MTPEEIEANAVAIMGMLRASGVTPQAAAVWGAMNDASTALERGRQAPAPGRQETPPPNFNQAEVDAALNRGVRSGPDAGVGVLGTPPPPAAPPLDPRLDPGNLGLVARDVQPDRVSSALNPLGERIGAWGVEQGGIVGDVARRAGNLVSGLEDMGRPTPEAAALMVAAPLAGRAAGPALELAGRGVRAVGDLISRFPRTAGATTLTGATLSGTGRTEEQPNVPENIREARGEASRRNAAVTTAETNLERLRTAGQRFTFTDASGERTLDFSSINTGSPRGDIEALQRFLANPTNGGHYRGRIDGNWGSGTQAALQAYQDANRQAVASADTALGRMHDDAKAARDRVLDLERSANTVRAFDDMPWYRRWMVENPVLTGGIAGALYGPTARVARTWLASRSARTAAREADALINPAGTMEERVSGANRFWARGGGREPFGTDPANPNRLTPRPDQQSVDELYRAPDGFFGSRYGAADIGFMVPPAGWAGYQRFLSLPDAQRELEEARRENTQRGTEDTARRLARAEANYATAIVLMRIGEGGLLGYAASGLANRVPVTRPNLQRAQTEVYNLNQALTPPPPPVTWSSPAGQRTLTLNQNTGRFFDPSGRDRRTYTEAQLRGKNWTPNQ